MAEFVIARNPAEVPAPEPTTADVRGWARRHGIDVPDRGRLRLEVSDAFLDAHD